MYTGGVSSLAEQIANQLQAKDDPRPLLEKRDLVRNMGVVVLVYISETAHFAMVHVGLGITNFL